MNLYRQIPLLRIFLLYLVGISWVVLFNYPHTYSILGLLLSFCLLAATFFYKKQSNDYRMRWVFGTFLSVFFIFAGVGYAGYVKKNHESLLTTCTPVIAMANILEKPILKNQHLRATANVVSYKRDSIWITASEKVMLYFFSDSLGNKLKMGDQIILRGKFVEITTTGNPDEFDYKKYLANQFIYRQLFLRSGEYKITAEDKGNLLLLWAEKIRNHCLKIFQIHKPGNDELAVIMAMILGDRSLVGNELKQSYSGSGTIHILSVSGQHVGILFIFLSRLLFFLKRKKYLYFIIVVFVLWAFAFISGLSPPVMRATVMFTFLQVGMVMKRQMNIYNTIIASAFLLLLANPFVLLDNGFQLSYLAVLGIVFFHPKIYGLVKFKNWVMDKTWELFSLSVAAQLATLPLVFLYFNKFPNYFFIANFIVIPLTGIVIYTGIFVLIFSFSYQIASAFSFLLNYSVKAINITTQYISKLPYAITDVYIDVLQAIILYAIMLFVSLYIVYRYRIYIWLSVIFMLFFSIACIYVWQDRDQQSQFIVYNIKNHTVMGFIKGRDCIFVGDEFIMDRREDFEKRISRYRQRLGLRKIIYIDVNEKEYSNNDVFFCKRGKFIQFFNKRIIFIDNQEFKNVAYHKKINADLLILSGNKNAHIQEILKCLDVKEVIVDPSVPYYLSDEYLKFCRTRQINCFQVTREGAFLLTPNTNTF